MRTILNTVGTSLCKNAASSQNPTISELVQFLEVTDPRRASAETNALSHILKEDDALVFLHSETKDGELCAKALATYYEQKGHESRTVLVKDLSYREADFRLRGLRSLVGQLFACIQEEKQKGREVLINATGGFKAESAYATLVGLLCNVPVYYIHEVFQEIIAMPPLPIGWDYSFVAEYEEIFEFLEADLRSRFEFKEKFRELPAKVRTLLAEEENYVFLSPAGEALFQAYRAKLTQTPRIPVYFSKRALEWYKEADATVQESVRRILRKLMLPEVRRNGAKKLKDPRCFVYPQGHVDERVFFCEKEDGIVICALTKHSDRSYDKIVRSGLPCARRGALTPFTEPF
ncbi:MAG: putative CRISPR-associated protein [Candidatus Caldatribacterium sp.]|uniref:putative CRISPR-associated protein n=1 Tax=Candidatus Caldatribacterium sp. TaxID=2282143 RepID=UPI00299C242E|nr:putative CRISPR-associated protein [Candidatus Caldatribacterium sp.]MCX7730724.1 putative CRISPR-associated protein [Candidatus Caldatribacterium sp.]MDW8082104.1 putative CRISPR-associated protein [Candidatus Calescibacterium sp.]